MRWSWWPWTPQGRINQPVIMLVILLADSKIFPLLSNLVLDEHIYFCYLLTLVTNEHPVPKHLVVFMPT